MASTARRFHRLFPLPRALFTVRCRMRAFSGFFSARRRPRRFSASGITGWRRASRFCTAGRRAQIPARAWRRWSARAGTARCWRASSNGSVPAGARIVQPARGAGVARIDNVGGTRLRPDHHAGRPARAVLRSSGRHHVARATDGSADCARLVEFELENSREKLGPFSNPAAVRALRSSRGQSHPRAGETDAAEREELRKQLEAELRAITQD